MSPAIGKCVLAALLLYSLYFFGLTSAGLTGPDEPRYASIGREMARSGDWVTPRLWDAPWFEKPALLYWMVGAAFLLGAGDDLAPRLPVALLSVAFLAFFFWIVRREFPPGCAWPATAILATCAGWLTYSQACATDLPMSAAFAAGMLLSLPWIAKGETKHLPWAGACFGLAVLGKGLVPLALAAPLAWFAVKRPRDWWKPALTFLLVAAPWYVLCTRANGRAFLDDFFLKHHLERFTSDAIQHVQPFWFYVPVLLLGLFPWSPGLALLARRINWTDPRRRLLVLWLAWGFVFFSASTNKLPGYLLPLLPAAAVLIALGLAESPRPQRWLAASAALLFFTPLVIQALPQALEEGLSRASLNPRLLLYGIPALLLAAGIPWLDRRGALACAVAATALAIIGLKVVALPEVDAHVSARPLWKQLAPHRSDTCVEDIHRAWRYGLNYYSVTPLPDCKDLPRDWHVVQSPPRQPTLVRVISGQPAKIGGQAPLSTRPASRVPRLGTEEPVPDFHFYRTRSFRIVSEWAGKV